MELEIDMVSLNICYLNTVNDECMKDFKTYCICISFLELLFMPTEETVYFNASKTQLT